MTDLGELAFLPEAAEQLRQGRKLATARRSRHGVAGDTFTAFGLEFEIESVRPLPLRDVAAQAFNLEGCDSPHEFAEVWERCYGQGAYRPEQVVYLHSFHLLP